MNVAKLIAEVKKGSPIGTIIGLMKSVFDDKRAAEDIYVEIIVVLDEFLMQGYRFESTQIQSLVTILKKLPAAGAKRRNFENLYLEDEYTLNKLPKDPSDIPFGHWH